MKKHQQAYPGQLDLFGYDGLPEAGPSASPEQQSPPSLAPTPVSNAPPPDRLNLMARQLHQELTGGAGKTIHLTITNNKRVMMSVQHVADGCGARVRLHRMFLTAPAEVRKALVHWIKHPRSKRHDALFKSFFAMNNPAPDAASPRKPVLRTRGRCYDLKSLFDELNRIYFDCGVQAAICWGMDRRQKTRSIRLGSYAPEERLIRIHPRLDQPFVPPYLVRYIVYHEMLHAHLGIGSGKRGRRRIHPPAFKQLEAAFPEYEKAIAWLKDSSNMNRILKNPR